MSKNYSLFKTSEAKSLSGGPDNFLSQSFAFDAEPPSSTTLFKVPHRSSTELSWNDQYRSAALGSPSRGDQFMEAGDDATSHRLHHLSRIKQGMKSHARAAKDVWVDLIERQAKENGTKFGRTVHKRRPSRSVTSNADS